MVGDLRFFYVFNSTWLTTRICEWTVIDTVDGEDSLEENTREITDMFDRMCQFGWIFLQLGCDILWWWWLTSKFSSYFQHVWKHKGHVVWWSTTGWMARATMRMKTWSSVTSWSLQLESLLFYSSLLASSSSFFNLMMASLWHLYTTLWCHETWFCQSRSHWRTLKWRDTSWYHHLTWCPPSKCPCHPQ